MFVKRPAPRPRSAGCARRAWRSIFCGFAALPPLTRPSLRESRSRSLATSTRAAGAPAALGVRSSVASPLAAPLCGPRFTKAAPLVCDGRQRGQAPRRLSQALGAGRRPAQSSARRAATPRPALVRPWCPALLRKAFMASASRVSSQRARRRASGRSGFAALFRGVWVRARQTGPLRFYITAPFGKWSPVAALRFAWWLAPLRALRVSKSAVM